MIETVRNWLGEGSIVRSEGYSSVALIRALARLCGASIPFEADGPERELSGQIGEHDHYLFVLVDGLGMNQTKHFTAHGFFTSSFVRPLRSVFPSTTAAALTTLHSGHWPSTHSITGWFTHLPDHRATVVPLRGIERFSEASIGSVGIPFADIVQVPSLFAGLDREVRSFTFRKFRSGPYADWSRAGTRIEGYRHLANAVRKVKRSLSRPDIPSFSYLYLSEVDHLSHERGRQAPEVVHEVREIDRALAKLRAVLPRSVRIIATADHGHIDVPADRHGLLAHDDPILSLLECPPSGEARVPLFHVRSGHEEEFRDAFATRFVEGGRSAFTLITPEEAEELALYGPGPLAPLTRSRLGTFIGLSNEADAIEFVSEGKESVNHIGMHGGMSPDEVEVPLFLA